MIVKLVRLKEKVMGVRDNVYWVVMKRQYLFGWAAHSLYATKRAADKARQELEASSTLLAAREYKVDRVVLIQESK